MLPMGFRLLRRSAPNWLRMLFDDGEIATPKGLESAPRPVEVEKRDETKGKWFRYTANLPDIGVAFEPVLLTAGESRSFRLQVESPGDYRLILRFLREHARAVCPAVGKRWRTVVSKEIHVRQ